MRPSRWAAVPAMASAAAPLHTFLTRLIWLCVGPLVVLAIFMAVVRVRDVQGARDHEAAGKAAALALAVDQDLDARIGALKMLAESPLIDDASRREELYREAQGFQKSFGSHVILADLDLQMLFNTRVPFGTPLPKLPRPKGRAAVPAALSSGKPAVGDAFQGPIAKESLVALAVPVLRNNGKAAFLLLTVFEAGQFQKHVDRLALPAGWSAALADSSGQTISGTPAASLPAAQVDAGGRFTAQSTVAPWSVVLEIRRDVYRGPLYGAAAVLALIVLGATLVGVVGGTLASRRLGRAVASLALPPTPGAALPDIREIAAVRERLDDEAHKREAAEAAMREGAALYRHTLDHMLEGCQIIDFDWRYRYVNAAGALQNRQSAQALMGRTMMEVYPGIDATEIFATLRRCMTERTAQHTETEFVFPDGSAGWFDVNVQPAPEGIVIFSVDITGRKRVEEMRQQLAAIVESSDDAIIGKTLGGIITSWNAGAERLFGYPAAEALGQPLLMLVPPERRDEEPEILARLARGENIDHFETVRVRKGGARVHVSATVSPIRDAQGQVIGASKIARDITDRKLAQFHLQAQLERLSLLDQITSAIGARQDLQSIYQVVVRSLEERLPVDFCCICRHDAVDGVLTVVHVGARSRALAMELAVAEHARIHVDANGLSRCVHGELVHEPDIGEHAVPFLQRLVRAGLHALVAAPLRSESRVFGVLMVARRQPRSFSSGECEFLRQLSAHVALAAQQAELHGALQRAYDELRQTQQAVMQQERLRALGQMASGIAHDINNAISPIVLYTETLLEHEAQLSERGRDYLQTIARSIDDVAATVARLREFYRQREAQATLAPVQLNAVAAQVVELTRSRWSDMPQQRGIVIDVDCELADDLPAVRGVEGELREALVNLVFNAVDAMPDGGALTLRTRPVPAPEPGAAPATARAAQVEVIDTGVGMDDDTRRRCLEPFFTTKGERGTGLGLAMVYGIVQRHGADIEIDSAVGRGTTVRLSFPAAALAAAALPPTSQAPASRLRILVVDDDPIVLKSLLDALEADGHALVAEDDGRRAIATFRAACGTVGDAFDIVITDLGMPHLDGRQVADAIKQASKTTPVILLTGWGQRLIADDDIPAHVDRVLGKPPKLHELRTALAQLTAGTRLGETPMGVQPGA